jgi:SAM-dependent methyltransferase
MTNELESIVRSVLTKIKHSDNDVWLDIGCNDGTLLKFVPKNFVKIGIDPSNDNCDLAKNNADIIYTDYFSKESYKYGKKCKVITSIAMFYDLEDPNKFCKDIYEVLDDDGVWVIQMSYTPLMLEQLAFDNICHEHLEYYDLRVLKQLLQSNGFVIK